MYVTRVPNRGSPPAILLRESYREGGKVKTRTLANLSRWPEAKIEALRRVLKGEAAGRAAGSAGDRAVPAARPCRRGARHGPQARSRPAAAAPARAAGHAGAGVDRRPGGRAGGQAGDGAPAQRGRRRRIRWARCWGWARSTRTSSTVPSICWARRSRRSRRRWPGAISRNGSLVLYDVTSSYLEGRCCELARFGYSRDGRRDKPQIVFGLLCAADGCPMAVEVFEGDTGDPSTLAAQVDKLKQRFGLKPRGAGRRPRHDHQRQDRRGAQARRARLDHRAAGAGHPGAGRRGRPLAAVAVRRARLAEITSPDYPGERLVVCRNPDLAAERARKREDLLAATEKDLARIEAATRARARAAARRGRDRAQGRRRARAAQDGQALPADHHRRCAHLRARRGRDRRGRRRSTASMSCAPPCRPRLSMRRRPCWPTRAWPRSSAPSARSSRSTSRSARSTIA